MEKIKKFIDNQFKGFNQSDEVINLKVELYESLIIKYQTAIKEGKTEDEAFYYIKEQFGDIEELKKEYSLTSKKNLKLFFSFRNKNLLFYLISSILVYFTFMLTYSNTALTLIGSLIILIGTYVLLRLSEDKININTLNKYFLLATFFITIYYNYIIINQLDFVINSYKDISKSIINIDLYLYLITIIFNIFSTLLLLLVLNKKIKYKNYLIFSVILVSIFTLLMSIYNFKTDLVNSFILYYLIFLVFYIFSFVLYLYILNKKIKYDNSLTYLIIFLNLLSLLTINLHLIYFAFISLIANIIILFMIIKHRKNAIKINYLLSIKKLVFGSALVILIFISSLIYIKINYLYMPYEYTSVRTNFTWRDFKSPSIIIVNQHKYSENYNKTKDSEQIKNILQLIENAKTLSTSKDNENLEKGRLFRVTIWGRYNSYNFEFYENENFYLYTSDTKQQKYEMSEEMKEYIIDIYENDKSDHFTGQPVIVK